MNMYETYQNLNDSDYELEIVEISQLTPRYLDDVPFSLTHTEIRLFLPETCTYATLVVRKRGVTVTLQTWVYGDCYDTTEKCYGTLLDAWIAVYDAAIAA